MEGCVYQTKVFASVWLTGGIRADIQLSELQRTLDAQGIEVVEHQKESVVGRKALADKTKGAHAIPICTACVLRPPGARIQEDAGGGEGKRIQGLAEMCVVRALSCAQYCG